MDDEIAVLSDDGVSLRTIRIVNERETGGHVAGLLPETAVDEL